MRILLMSNLVDLGPEQSFANIVRAAVSGMQKADPNVYVTVAVPKGWKSEYVHEHLIDVMPDPNRVGYVPVTMNTASAKRLTVMASEEVFRLLNQTKADVPYDVVLNMQPPLSMLFDTLLDNKYMGARHSVTVPIVNWHVYTATRRTIAGRPVEDWGDLDLMARSVSVAYGFNVWESQITYEANLETLREVLKPAALRRVIERSCVVNNGIEIAELDRLERDGPRDRPRVLWGVASLHNPKGQAKTFPLLQRIAETTSAEVRITVGNEGAREVWEPKLREECPSAEVLWGLDPKQFRQELVNADVFVCLSPFESYGIAWLEMLGAGMLGVFADAWWIRRLLPPWYPFVTDDPNDALAMAKQLCDTWPDGPLWDLVPKVQEWLRKEHDVDDLGPKLLDVCQSLHAESLEADARFAKGGIGELALKAVESGTSPVGEAEVWSRMEALSDSGREFGKKGDILSRMWLRRALEVQGWKDEALGPEVTFVRS